MMGTKSCPKDLMIYGYNCRCTPFNGNVAEVDYPKVKRVKDDAKFGVHNLDLVGRTQLTEV